MPPLLECLRGHPTLQQLMLDDNELENDGAEAIADFFATEASVHAPSSPLDWVLPGAVVVVWPHGPDVLRAGSWLGVHRRCRICAS